MEQKIFNPTCLDEWSQVDPQNWRPMVSSLIELFLSMSQEKHAALEQAWSQRNWRQLGELAHALKSSCGSVGAVRAQTLLNVIEASAQIKDAASLVPLIRELDKVFAESIKELIIYRESLFQAA